jgi:hypothetical protein
VVRSWRFLAGAALSESGLDFGVGVTVGVRMLLKAEGEHGVFEGSGAIEAPLVLRDGLGEIDFEGADWGEGFADSIAVFSEGGLVFRGMDHDLAGEAVAEGVQRRTFFAFFGTRAGG